MTCSHNGSEFSASGTFTNVTNRTALFSSADLTVYDTSGSEVGNQESVAGGQSGGQLRRCRNCGAAAGITPSVWSPLQRNNQAGTIPHPEFGPRDLARPQWAHPRPRRRFLSGCRRRSALADSPSCKQVPISAVMQRCVPSRYAKQPPGAPKKPGGRRWIQGRESSRIRRFTTHRGCRRNNKRSTRKEEVPTKTKRPRPD